MRAPDGPEIEPGRSPTGAGVAGDRHRRSGDRLELEVRNEPIRGRVLLRRPARLNGQAKAARMAPVEGPRDRRPEARLPGIPDDHARPRGSLQHGPMQSQEQDQHQHSQASRRVSHGGRRLSRPDAGSMPGTAPKRFSLETAEGGIGLLRLVGSEGRTTPSGRPQATLMRPSKTNVAGPLSRTSPNASPRSAKLTRSSSPPWTWTRTGEPNP